MAMASGQMAVHAGEDGIALGFDPGRDKTGFAFADMAGGLVVSGIFPTDETEKFFADFSPYVIEGDISSADGLMSRVNFIVIGNGTTGRAFTERVRKFIGHEIITVDERNTTLEARSLYWKIHRPGILARLLPEGMRVPPRVIDDLAAWAVALRGLKEYRDIRRNKL